MKGQLSVDEALLYFGEGDEVCFDCEVFTGIAFRRHANGKLWRVKRYVNGFAEGICREWHGNGKIKRRWRTKHGQVIGTEREWYADGGLKCIRENEFGVITKEREYDSDGQLVRDFTIGPEDDLFEYLMKMKQRATPSA